AMFDVQNASLGVKQALLEVSFQPARLAVMALVDGLERWLSQNAFASVTEIRGRLDGTHVDRADMFSRTQYLRTIAAYTLHYPPVGPDGLAASAPSSIL